MHKKRFYSKIRKEGNMVKKPKQASYEKDKGGATIQNGEIIRIPAIRDFMFKNLFGVNGKEENLKGLLQAILKIKIESLQIQNPELPREYEKSKRGVLDVRAKLQDGTIASIEMQVKDENNIGERITFYICKLYISTIGESGKYEDMPKTIAIAITNFSYFNRKEYHQIAHLKFENCQDQNEMVEQILKGEETSFLADKLEIHIIDLKKFRMLKEPKGELADWLNLILGNEEEITMASKKNEAIAKANKENKKLSKNKEMQEMYDLSREMYELDQRSREAREAREAKEREELIKKEREKAIAEGRTKGIAEGIEEGRAEGREEGRKKGREEGREEGRAKGRVEGKLEIAQKLLNKNMEIEEIIEITGLAKEEIEKL